MTSVTIINANEIRVKCEDCPDEENCTMAHTEYTKDGCVVREFV